MDRERVYGKVKFFSQEKAWGFLTQDGGKDVFVHISGLDCTPEQLQEGASVSFRVVEGQKGPKAVSVRVHG